ncbi:MAG: flagellar assembly protein FliW [Deltaproteobacteria bacterium]|nr:flagellar assembly protein FliW [Deltaproteobacteria bacterium]MBW2085171.1 flagellar assembly protein FliW [Deltaproteobacteria bacterium]
MKIRTTRFGEIEVEDEAVISVPGGLIGFSDQERYVIIEHKPESPFFWFQAVDRPDLAFVIANPFAFKPDYDLNLSEDILADLGIEDPEDMVVYVIMTIPHGRPQDMTANLLGPLIINTKSRIVRQIILDDSEYSHRYPISAPSHEAETS